MHGKAVQGRSFCPVGSVVRDTVTKRLYDKHSAIRYEELYGRSSSVESDMDISWPTERRSISNKAEKAERAAIIFDFRLSSHVRQVSSISPEPRSSSRSPIQRVSPEPKPRLHTIKISSTVLRDKIRIVIELGSLLRIFSDTRLHYQSLLTSSFV